MPLNKVDGEHLNGLGRGKPAPISKWERFVDVAADLARKHFESAGAPSGFSLDPDQILVQDFWLHSTVVITFCVPISGVEHFYNYTLDLSREAVAELALSGHWPATFADLPKLRAN
jgi:hypothetical protein